MKPMLRVVDAIKLPPPELSGAPGERSARCVRAELVRRGGKRQAVLTFEVRNPESGSVEIGTLWVEIPDPLAPHHRYVRLVRLALGSEAQPGESATPQAFTERRFHVRVGYRRTEKPKGRGRADDALSERKKDDRDFLRVLDILARIDL